MFLLLHCEIRNHEIPGIWNIICVKILQCMYNITDWGKTAVVLPTGCPRSVGLLAGLCRTKGKVPTIPLGWGGWEVVTNDWCITKYFSNAIHRTEMAYSWFVKQNILKTNDNSLECIYYHGFPKFSDRYV